MSSLSRLQQRLVKSGGRLEKHAGFYWLLLAEGHLTRPLVRKHAAADGGFGGASGVAERAWKIDTAENMFGFFDQLSR